MYADTTTIAYVNNAAGIPVGRITMQDDWDAPCSYEGPHEYAPALTDGVTVRAVWVGHGTDPDWYETGDHSRHDEAWRRIREGENAEGIGEYIRTDDEAVELFTRYMRVFHPLVPVIDRWVTTGYSQGDSVRLIAWADRRPTDGPAYQWASLMHSQCEGALDFIGEFARGQFVSIAYESMTTDHMEVDGDRVTMEVSWCEEDRVGGVHYAEEFNPAPEALRVARHSLSIPAEWEIGPLRA